MRLLQVDVEKGWGGGQRQVLLLCLGLLSRGHEVALACRSGSPLLQRAFQAGIEVFPLAPAAEIDPRAVLLLARRIRSYRPDLLHLHSSHSHALGLLAAPLARLQRRVVSRRVEIPPGRGPLNRWKYGRGVSRFLAISAAVARVLAAAGVDPRRITVVPSGVQPLAPVPGARESVRREWGLPGDCQLLGCVGSLVPAKGHRTLLRAAPQLLERNPRLCLFLAGDGRLRPGLERLAADLGAAGRVVFAGHREDVPRLLSSFDIAAFPSLSEGLGTSILDALSLELPVVASRTGGIPEIIAHGENGLLVEPDSPGELGGAVERLLADPAAAALLGQRGKETVLERFSVQGMVEGTEAAYRELLGDG